MMRSSTGSARSGRLGASPSGRPERPGDLSEVAGARPDGRPSPRNELADVVRVHVFLRLHDQSVADAQQEVELVVVLTSGDQWRVDLGFDRDSVVLRRDLAQVEADSGPRTWSCGRRRRPADARGTSRGPSTR